MNWILRAKHWQLFILLFALPVLIQLSAGILAYNDVDLRYLMVGVFFNYLIFAFALLSWIYHVIALSRQRSHPKIALNPMGFRIAFFFLLLYVVLSLFFILNTFLLYNFPDYNNFRIDNNQFFIIFHFMALISLVFIYLLAAKSLKTALLERKVNLADYILDFFLFVILPIGVWFLQPRINKMNGQLKSQRRDILDA